MYNGIQPKDIDINYPDHTYDKVVCLINGQLKSFIQERYLKKLGFSKEEYASKFSDPPLVSMKFIEDCQARARSAESRAIKSKTMKKLNLTNSIFQEKRKSAVKQFLDSDRSVEYRAMASERTKEQHRNGQADYVRKYFNTVFKGSADQKNRSRRMKENNPAIRPEVIEKGKATYIANHNHGFHATTKNIFKHYDLQFQSSYEYKFLEYCEEKGVIQHVTRAPTFKDDIYPRRYYLPDYILYGEYAVEIKSWYIEQRQEILRSGITEEKRSLITRSGYKWLYILDFDYTELDSIILSNQLVGAKQWIAAVLME
jgi:hypothetical protein